MIRWLQILVGIVGICFGVQAQTIRWGSSQVLHFTQPITDDSMASLMVGNLIYDPLVRFGAKGDLEPRLLTHWKQLSPTSWQLQLRTDVFFSSGNPLQAHDVIWSLQQLRKHPFYRQLFSVIHSVKANSSSQLVVSLNTPSPDFLYRLTYWFVYDQRWQQAKLHPKHLLASGSGPYQVVEHLDGIRSVLVHKHAQTTWAREGMISQIDVIPMRLEKTRFTALVNGDVDIVDRLAAARWDSLIKIPFLEPKPARYMNWVGLIYNENRSPLNNFKVRKALSLAIDSRMLSLHVVQQLGELATQLSPADAAGHNNAITANYNPDLAYQLIEQAGLSDNEQRLKLVVMKNAHMDMVRCALLLKLMLMRLNIEITTTVLDRDEFEDALAHCQGDLFLMTLQGRPNDTMMRIKYFLYGLQHQDTAPLHCSAARESLRRHWRTIEQSSPSLKTSKQLGQFVYQLAEGQHFKPLFWQHALWGVNAKLSAKAIDNSMGFPYFDEIPLLQTP
ncbi:ABC transporter substrate-binding protein [Celerinatantimonas sp. YJH-8]|uniref:ABC transporter substrate-binding protein n=1 Tax=Celerinatantimonas sp. YJH-8 TaxID=3228714 RepID=UPI0038BFEA9F